MTRAPYARRYTKPPEQPKKPPPSSEGWGQLGYLHATLAKAVGR